MFFFLLLADAVSYHELFVFIFVKRSKLKMEDFKEVNKALKVKSEIQRGELV